MLPAAQAAGGVVKSPTGIAPDRYVYYPGTEALKPDEIRGIACGTGMPAARRSQAAACFLIETGNGDKFLFDLGTGSMANVAALMIPYDALDKVFLSHLHTDHMGDLDALWAGGWTAGRTRPLQVWGPSGQTPEMGTKYSIDGFMKFVNWDRVTRNYKVTPIPGQVVVHEFDYRAENQIIYQKNGVTIRSWPAVHAGDGPVSFSLEYDGMRIVLWRRYSCQQVVRKVRQGSRPGHPRILLATPAPQGVVQRARPARLAGVLRGVPHVAAGHGQGHESGPAAPCGCLSFLQ